MPHTWPGLIVYLPSCSLPAVYLKADTTRTPADLNLGDDGDSTGDVGGAGDGDKSRDKPQDGSIGDGGDVDRDDDREVANSSDGDRDTNSSSDDTPEDKSQDTPQNEPQGGAQQSQDGFSEPQDDCNEPIGVGDVPQDASFNFEDTAVDAGQNADSTSQPGPTETEQQKEQEQTQKQEERQQEQQQQQEEQVAPGSERRRSERLVVANKVCTSIYCRSVSKPSELVHQYNSCTCFAHDHVQQYRRTHTLGRFSIFKAGFLDSGGGVLNTPSDASMQPSRRSLSKATIFVVCAPHVFEETGSECCYWYLHSNKM